jgi:hypothetical protein
MRLDAHGIDVLEAWAHPVFARGCATRFRFRYDARRLRHSISGLIDLTWCKARKKLVGSRDAYGSRKNMFHAFRIMGCALELAERHRSGEVRGRVGIADWTAWAPLYRKFMALPGDDTPDACTIELWREWDVVYGPRLKKLRSRFRLLCPQ